MFICPSVCLSVPISNLLNRISQTFHGLFVACCNTAPTILNFYLKEFWVSESKTWTWPLHCYKGLFTVFLPGSFYLKFSQEAAFSFFFFLVLCFILIIYWLVFLQFFLFLSCKDTSWNRIIMFVLQTYIVMYHVIPYTCYVSCA